MQNFHKFYKFILGFLLTFFLYLFYIFQELKIANYLLPFTLSILFIFYSKDFKFNEIKNIKLNELLITFLIYFSLINFLLNIIFEILNNTNILNKSIIYSTNSGQDPVRWWPSGTAQSWGVIGAALAAYRTVPGDSKKKAIAAFATLGVTAPMAVFSMAIENPNGFNRLMYSWIEYNRTGVWPGNIPNQVSNNTVNTKFETESSTKVDDYKDQVKQNF
jgi:hypothetical protein